MALEEVNALIEEFLSLFKHDHAWTVHTGDLIGALGFFDIFLQRFSNHIQGLSIVDANAIVSATLALTVPPGYFRTATNRKRFDTMIDKYKKENHHGLAYVLLMHQMIKWPGSIPSGEKRFMSYWQDFKHQCAEFYDKYNNITGVKNLSAFMIIHSRCVPTELYVLPKIKESLALGPEILVGHYDCLSILERSFSHIIHDSARLSSRFPKWRDDEIDEVDVLGRHAIHLACLRADYQLLRQMEFTEKKVLEMRCFGLRALDIAAMKGDPKILTYMFLVSKPQVEEGGGPTMRNCLHWAASCGHLEAVTFLCSRFIHFLDDVIHARDYLGDTPIHLAARFGHTKIVEYLLPWMDWQIVYNSGHHSPFFSAVTGGHITTMKVLRPYSNVDKLEPIKPKVENATGTEDEKLDYLTPLAEAARQGFSAGVRYLLELNVKFSSRNSVWNPGTCAYDTKTPLDLALEGNCTECIALLSHQPATRRNSEQSASGATRDQEPSQANSFDVRQSISSVEQSPTSLVRQLPLSSHSPASPFPPLSAPSPISVTSELHRSDVFLRSGGGSVFNVDARRFDNDRFR